MSKFTVAEIAAAKGMSKTNAWWHVRKLWTEAERVPMYVHGVLKMTEAQARQLMNRMDGVPDIKKQARGPREEKKGKKG
jgi:hypothetical protein